MVAHHSIDVTRRRHNSHGTPKQRFLKYLPVLTGEMEVNLQGVNPVLMEKGIGKLHGILLGGDAHQFVPPDQL